MTATREATTIWTGGLADGSGQTHLDSSNLATFEVSWPSRIASSSDNTTSPEELIAAAHASCFSMAFSNELGKAGYTPERVKTTAVVTLEVSDSGAKITTSHLLVAATVPGIPTDTFEQIAEGAKAGCPVSQALAGVTITLEAALQ